MAWPAPPFTPGVSWEDLPSQHTPENAANLNLAESSPATYAATVGASVASYFEGGQSASVPTVSPSGGAPASPPTVWLDSYYDSTIYANKSAAIQAAYAAAAAGRAVLECQAKRVYSLDTAPLKFAPSTPIIIEGHGATFQANWGKPRCIDFTRTADGQTWNNIDVRDLTFDANNLTSVVNQSVVGNVVDGGGVNFQRVNLQSVYFRRCRWINVHTAVPGDGTATVSCFDLESSQPAAGQPESPQNTMIDVRVEGAYARGGNYGFKVNGTSSTIAAVNVYLDRIYLDFDWDSGVVQSGATVTAGGNQIGSLGFGDYCEVHAIIANAGDVGIEIDGMQTAHVWGRCTDARNVGFFGRNFQSPPDIGSQKLILHGCEDRITAALSPDPGTYQPVGFQVGHTSAPNPTFGELVLENCKFRSASANLRANGSALNVPAGALVSAVTVVGTFTAAYDAVSDAPGSSQTPSPIFMLPGTAGAFTLSGGNIRIVYAGTGNANTKPRSMILSPQAGCTMIVDLGHIAFASSLAGVSVGNTRGLFVGLSGSGGGSIRGRIRSLGWESFSGADTAPQLYVPLPSGTITIDGRLVVDEVDLRKDPAAAPTILNTAGGVDTTNKALLPVRSAILPTYPIASVAMGASNFASATFTTATGNQYLGGLPAEIHFATGTGAAITAIDVSKDGTTYENAYTQASGAMAQSVLVPVENGDFIKVTFATQPATRVRFRRAQ